MSSDHTGLLEQFNSNGESFAGIYNKLFKEFTRFAIEFVGEIQEAEDIVAEAMSRAYMMREAFENEANIRAFLLVTVRNRCLNYLRHRKVVMAFQKYKTSIGDGDGAGGNEYRTEILKRIFDATAAMPDKRKRIFLMVYLEDRSAAEIAVHLEIDIQTVYSHIRHAINDIKEFLNKSHG